MHRKKRLYLLVCACVLLLACILPYGPVALAHSGRTDSSGGHKDNQNKSGLGSYHYHCNGNPSHLHTDGVCPYSAKSSGNASGSSGSKSSGSSSGTSPNPIQIKNQISSLAIGEEYTLEVSSTDGSTAYTYTSSNPTVAEVTPEGKVIGHTAGKAEITIKTSSGKTRLIRLTIKEVNATSISFESTSNPLVLYVGKTYEPTIVFAPENTTNKAITLSSSDENIISVHETSLTANTEGQATITATSTNGKTAILNVIVEQILPIDIEIENDKIDLFLGNTVQLSYEVIPADATNRTVSFEADEKVLAIEENTITGVALGKTTLVLKTNNGITKEIEISVLPIPITAMYIQVNSSIEKKVFRLAKNEQLPISVIIEPNNATEQTYTWNIENPNVAAIENGQVVFKGYGKTKIAIEHEGFSDSIEISYYNPFWTTMLRIFVIAALLTVILFMVRKFWFKRTQAATNLNATNENEENL